MVGRVSRRVVCSHGSSLGTAVQYAGQGKVTLLCVRACARGASHYCTYPRIYTSFTQSLSRCDYRGPKEIVRE